MLTRRERFERKVDRTGPCHLWTGYENDGRPMFWTGEKYVFAHRWIFGATHGYLPQVVRHTCDTPLCVRVQHLLPGTQSDNVKDMRERDRAVPPPVHSGELHPNAKLTDAQVIEIKKLYAAGDVGSRALGARFGVSGTQVLNIVKGVQRAQGGA